MKKKILFVIAIAVIVISFLAGRVFAAGNALTGTVAPAQQTPTATKQGALTGTTPAGRINWTGAGNALTGTAKPVSVGTPGGTSIALTGTRSSGIMAVVNLFKLTWK